MVMNRILARRPGFVSNCAPICDPINRSCLIKYLIFFTARFKDDHVFETRMESGLSTLVLENVSTNSSGTYGCRANNDYSAVVSSGGRVNIRGKLRITSSTITFC